MDTKAMKNVIEAFKERDNFLVTAHVNPEGDSVGSQLAVCDILKRLGKKVIIVDHDDVPENLRFLKGTDLITKDIPEGFCVETVVALDCPVRERTGDVLSTLKEGVYTINIDHHVSNEQFGDINWVEYDTSSVGEMIFSLIREMKLDEGKDMAEAVYAAILTDTGMFNYDNTSIRTHEIAGELISSGVDPKKIHHEIYEKKSVSEIKLLGEALSTLQVDMDGRIAYIKLTKEMYGKVDAEGASTDEFINFARSIKGAEVAVFFKENGDAGRVNVSFRSTGKADVNVIASHFGGGGHTQASGCVLECGMDEAVDKVISETIRVLGAK